MAAEPSTPRKEALPTPSEVTATTTPESTATPTESVPAPQKASPPDGETAIGSIAEIEGTATISRFGTETAELLAINDPVFMDDIIETGVGSRLHILFADETEITISENSQLTVDEYIYDETNKTAPRHGRFNILRGAFIFVSGKINKDGGNAAIEVPYGSIGMRGTTVWGGETDSQYGVLVTDGEASVENSRGRVRLVAGQGSDLAGFDATPGKPRLWGESRVAKAVETIKLRAPEKVKERVAEIKSRHKAGLERRAFLNDQRRARLENLRKERQAGGRGETLSQRREKFRQIQQRSYDLERKRLAPPGKQPQKKREQIRDNRQDKRGELQPPVQKREMRQENRQENRQDRMEQRRENIQDRRQQYQQRRGEQNR